VGLGALLLLYYGLPLIALLITQSPAELGRRLADAQVRRAALVSLGAAGTTTVLSALLGLPLAYGLARGPDWWTTPVTALVVLPLVFPPIVSGMLLLSVFGPSTWIGSAAATAGLPLTRSFAAVVLAQTFVASPFTVITAKSAFEGVPRRYEQASRLLGTGRWTTLRRVTLPLAAPGVAAGLLLTFARSMGEFGATLMVAYYPRTLPVQIWVAFTTLGLDSAFPVAAVLALLSILVLVLLNRLGPNAWE
jgi:molybdate/tungstate transport system permease protein